MLFVYGCTRHPPLLYEDNPLWLIKALLLDGEIQEKPGPEHNEWIIEALRYSGVSGDLLADETSWCASAMNYILKDCGIMGTGSALAESYLEWGASVKPRKGGIAVFRSKEGFHVTILVKEKPRALGSGDHYRCIGGNQGDAYKISWQPASDLVDVRWPTQGDKMRNQARNWIEEAAKAAGITHVIDSDASDANSLLLPLPRVSFEVMPTTIKRQSKRLRCEAVNTIVQLTHEVKLNTRNTIRVSDADADHLDHMVVAFIGAFPKYKETSEGFPVRVEASKVDYGGYQHRIVDVLTQREAVVWVSFAFGIYDSQQLTPLEKVGVDIGINGGFNVS
jgi:uncharacterized protein (TIGR02594 family)